MKKTSRQRSLWLALSVAWVAGCFAAPGAAQGPQPSSGDEAEDRRSAALALRQWDANRDGALDVHEVLKVPGPEVTVRRWFRHDRDRDGRLTQQELTAYWTTQRTGDLAPGPAARAAELRLATEPCKTVDLDDELRLVNYSPEGRYLAAAGQDAVHVLEGESGRPVHRIAGHETRVISVDFSPDGRTLLSGSHDRTAKFWEVATGRQVGRSLRHGRRVCFAVFSPDGRMAVTAPDANAETTVDVWAVPDGPKTVSLRGATGTITRLAFTPDGRLLASAEWDRSGVHVWNFETGDLRWSGQHSGHVVCVEFAADGKTLATGGWDNAMRLWNADDGKPLRTIRPPGGAPIETLSWWPDGRTILCGSRNGRLSVIDVASGNTLQQFTAHDEPLRGIAISPDARTVATCSTDQTLKLWDVR